MAYVARRYSPFRPKVASRPMSDMNVTPFIDVLLVLIIMLIMVVPIATHSLDIPLPTARGTYEFRDTNTVSIDAQDHLFWNGQAIGRQELLNQLASAAKLPDDPVVRFEPDALASYDMSARTIALIKDSGIKNFAFAGNYKYREFER